MITETPEKKVRPFMILFLITTTFYDMTTRTTTLDDTKTTTTTTATTTSAKTMMEQSTVTPEEDESMYYIMAAIAGTVLLIIVIVITAFIIKSRRKRRQNVRVYMERRERPLTVSLEFIDREEPVTEAVNGVQNELYSQDSILPIVVYETQGQDQTSGQQPETVQSAGTNETHKNQSETSEVQADKSYVQQNETIASAFTQNETIASAFTQNETIASSFAVYENTKVSNHRFLTASDKPKQLSMPNLNDDTKYMRQKRHNSQKQAKNVSIDGDYETAFPVFPVRHNKVKTEFVKADTGVGNEETDKNKLLNDVDNCPINEEHNDATEVHIEKEDAVTETKVSETRHEKLKPKVKPKPNVRRLGNISNVLNGNTQNEDESHDYENSLAQIKRTKFREARLLKTVPPPCNKNTYANVPKSKSYDSTSKTSLRRQSSGYVNVPEKQSIDSVSEKSLQRQTSDYVNVPEKQSNNSASEKSLQRQSSAYVNVPEKVSINSTSEKSFQRQVSDYVKVPEKISINPASEDSVDFYKRQSSEYEDPGCVRKLKKQDKCITTLAELNFEGENVKHEKQNDSKRGESKLKATGTRPKQGVTKSKLPVPKPKLYGLECKQSKSKTAFSEKKAKLDVSKPEYANIAVRGRTLSENPESKDLDYENEDTFKELKSTLKRLGKRGFSTSSLETCRQDKMWRTGKTKTQGQTVPKPCTIIDDNPYLMMDAVNNDDDDTYLRMDSPKEHMYMTMVNPEENNVYMPMKNNYSFQKSEEASKRLLSNKDEDVRFARCYQTCPKPCGGVRSVAYANFSEQPTRYANFFRSASVDNVYSYVGSKPVIKF